VSSYSWLLQLGMVCFLSHPVTFYYSEPTSGLDARAAGIVMRGMRRIADAGIAVVATIHQPSVAIFNDFDNLLLLKAGGETVFFGDLGKESCNLIEYLEGYDSTVPIRCGENPATWMLSCIGAGSAAIKDSFDYARAYANSKLATECIKKIDEYNGAPDERLVGVVKMRCAVASSSTNTCLVWH
jgi:ABC-type multidrug transport system ATPase subunit